MRAALDYLLGADVATIKLDVTAAGRPVYESLDFIPETLIERWEGVAQPASAKDLAAIDEQTRPAIGALDRLAFGVDRTKLLDPLIADSSVMPLVATAPSGGQLRGYGLARRGSNASYVGPLVSTDGGTAVALLDGMLGRLAGEKVHLDFHTGSGISSKLLAERGLVRQGDLVRMRYERESSAGASSLIFAITGPEIG